MRKGHNLMSFTNNIYHMRNISLINPEKKRESESTVLGNHFLRQNFMHNVVMYEES